MKVDTAAKDGEALSRSLYQDLLALTKPTITLLVIVTAVPSLFMGSKIPSWQIILMTLLGTALSSASAGVFNQLFETNIDNIMVRTRKRSIPSGKVSPVAASVFGTLLLVLGFGFLYYFTTPLAAWVALAGHLFYVLFYTLFLKQRTPQNIVIGGAAGAVGPLIGWAAVHGDLAWPAWVLFLIIVLWTPPHFWSLAIKYKDDYASVGIPMYPVVYGEEKTRRAIFLYTLTLLPAVLSLYVFNVAGLFYLIVSMGLTLKFVIDAFQLMRSKDQLKLMPFFYFSCIYTFGIFGAITFDRLWALL